MSAATLPLGGYFLFADLRVGVFSTHVAKHSCAVHGFSVSSLSLSPSLSVSVCLLSGRFLSLSPCRQTTPKNCHCSCHSSSGPLYIALRSVTTSLYAKYEHSNTFAHHLHRMVKAVPFRSIPSHPITFAHLDTI